MTSEPIRDPRADHLLTPQNCALVVSHERSRHLHATSRRSGPGRPRQSGPAGPGSQVPAGRPAGGGDAETHHDLQDTA